MNIKSLLLGSAAGLVAVSGAQAADAIVYAEPEPVEYVRVCDVYGAGFFYIPGTETCLRIGGEVRYQIGTSSDGFSYHGYPEDTYAKEARGRFFLDARSDTELGTLRGYIRVDASRGDLSGTGNSANAIRTNKAFLELGGLKMGWEDSAWAFTPNAGAANFGSHSDSGMAYGYQQRNLVQYNFAGGNGFFATISLEENNANASSAVTAASGGGFYTGGAVPAYSDPSYTPDVVGKLGVNQAWGAVWAAAAYDNDRTNASTVDFLAATTALGTPVDQIGSDGWAAQLGLHFNVPNAPGSSLKLIGYYADSDNAYNGHGGEWSVLGSYYHQFTPTFGASVGGQYVSDLYAPGTDISTGLDGWLAELNLVWTPVQDFAVRTEVVYQDYDGFEDATSGFIRFSRFF